MYYEIVPMDRSHIPPIAALERACFSHPWSEAMLTEALFDTQASFIVAESEDGGVLGYAGLQVVLDEGYIDNIAVEPNARRHGVADELLDVFCRFGAANLEIMAEDGTYTAAVNSEGAVAAMQYLKDLRWKYNVLPDTLIASRTEGMQWMSVDQLGMMITPPDVFGNMCRTYGIAATNLGEFSIPSGPNGAHAVLTGGSANMFNPDATPEEVDAAFKWLAVTGYTPECTDEVKTALEENVKAQLADGNVVSNLNMSVWVGGEKREAEIAIREKCQNIEPTKMTDYMENGSKDLHPEEPVEVQALYAMLDSVIQEVFTNENADVQALLDSVNADFQSQYLDPYNDTLK